MSSPTLFLSAGDPSGDNASARLVDELARRMPGLAVFGLGGPGLRQRGQEQLALPADLAVLGFWEVAKRFRFFQKLMACCVSEIRTRRPDCVILVDYPGFNLRLAKRIRTLGIPVIYYISPQIWAWGHRRLPLIRQCVDLMLLILPFEQRFYANTGVNSKFVGHYLLEDIPAEYISSRPPVDGTLALLPGSRRQEVERMLPVMLKTAQKFKERHGTRAVVAAAGNGYDYDAALSDFQSEDVELVYDDARRVIHQSTLVLSASGTATLEAAIIGRPMVVVYKTGNITYQIARRLIKIDKIALVNLVLNDKVAPELIQHDATPEKMLAALSQLYTDEERYDATCLRFNEAPGLLGGTGASARAASMIHELLEKPGGR
ncbi:MAG: lipid-A-disaccharide synthase [candidate division Zixibacteria bacterium]|nr:lipid-A-disaccharide synthase [candidate division Zixibacteria bacterium]MDH3937401.1 lipid-A-disaccharide synthase [candidate division Zixibacteria bacterium]MDH4033304.1 lipid-A-disaccharide synthase [candidate division Zixibacteria bacterium]